jgi:very-short-patch-repair endonuclease
MGECGSEREHTAGSEPHLRLEAAIGANAAPQHGVVSLAQVNALGVSSDATRKRVSSGRWHRVYPGVFAIGHAPLTRDGHYMAAVLACGPGAGLSHRSAADKLGLRATHRSRIDIISPRRPGRRHASIDAHTSRTLLPRDIKNVDGIPCTTIARTLLDLAAILPRRTVERAIDQAEILQLLDTKAIQDVLDRTHGHQGNAPLHSILNDHLPGSTPTRNDLEEAFLQICRTGGLPQPEVNAHIPFEPIPYQADFLWREHQLIAETDGRDTHTTRQAFEHDRKRDQQLMLAGFRVVRFPWQQVTQEPSTVEKTVRALIDQASINPRRIA